MRPARGLGRLIRQGVSAAWRRRRRARKPFPGRSRGPAEDPLRPPPQAPVASGTAWRRPAPGNASRPEAGETELHRESVRAVIRAHHQGTL
jgi:hypothetical protein